MFAVYVAVFVLTLNAVALCAYTVRFLVHAAGAVAGVDELAARRAQRSQLAAP